MTIGSRPRRSSKQAPPESANQLISQSSGFSDTKSAAGAAIQKLRQLKQSISFPTGPRPSRARNLAIRSAGPSSLANRCVTRQVARVANTNRIQKVSSLFNSSRNDSDLKSP